MKNAHGFRGSTQKKRQVPGAIRSSLCNISLCGRVDSIVLTDAGPAMLQVESSEAGLNAQTGTLWLCGSGL